MDTPPSPSPSPSPTYSDPYDSPPPPPAPSPYDSPPAPPAPSPYDSPPAPPAPSPTSLDPPPPPSPTSFNPPPPPPSPSSFPTSFDSPPPPPPSPSSLPTSFDSPPPTPSPSPAGLIVGSVIAGVVALAVVVGVVFYVCVYKKKDKEKQKPEEYALPLSLPDYSSSPLPSDISIGKEQVVSSVGLKPFSLSYEELVSATDHFSNRNLLGSGGFSTVYRGIRSSGEMIAVKRLKANGDQGMKEFQAEVQVINRVHHRHLVSLVGYCITPNVRMLVYEHVPNNSLDSHLHDTDGCRLTWSTRLKIAIGSAKGLAYLHEDCHPRIIHRDIKAANILLDSNFEAKVADFGLAKLIPAMQSHVIPSTIIGSHGYIAPEYTDTGNLTCKSDVYSYGVLLLELITGRRAWSPNEYGTLVSWAKPLLEHAKEKKDCSLWVDRRLEMVYDKKEMARMITCAAACIHRSPERRPQMSQIVRALGGDDSTIDRIAAACTTDDVTGSSDGSSIYGTTRSTLDRSSRHG